MKGARLTGTDAAPFPTSFPRNESDPLTAASHALHTRHISSSPSTTVYCHTNVLYVQK